MSQSSWGGTGDLGGWGQQPWGGFYTALPAPPPDLSFGGIVSAVEVGDAIDLDWAAATDLTGPSESLIYLVYRCRRLDGENFNFGTPYATTGPGVLTYHDSTVTRGKAYAYIVRVQNPALEIDDNVVEIDVILYPDVVPGPIAGTLDPTRARKTYSSVRPRPRHTLDGSTDVARFRKTYSFYPQRRR